MIRGTLNRLPLGWAGRLALQRLVAQWRSLLTIIAGVLLSAAVGALIPLYTTAVAQVSMVEHLNQLPLDTTNITASLALIPSQIPARGTFDDQVQQRDQQFRALVSRYLGSDFPGWLNQTVFYGETSALSVDPPAVVSTSGGEPRIPDPTTRVFVAYYERWTEAVALIAGRLPLETPDSPGADIEIVIPFEAQSSLGINVGDVLTLDQGGPRGGWPTSKNILARIVGVVTLPDTLNLPATGSAARAYFMAPSPVRFTTTRGEFQAEYPVLTTQSAFERVATQFVPDTPTRFGWRLLFEHSRLPFTRSPDARRALLDFQNAVTDAFSAAQNQGVNYQLTYRTKLIDFQQQGQQNVDQGALIDYERNVRSLDAPFGLLLLQIGALVLFFLIVTAALVRRGERREVAMLQSRGAPDRALVLVRGIEALIICLIGVLVAPILAQQTLIAITPFFASYPNLPLLLTPQVFAYAGGASAAAFFALMFTLRPLLRLPLVSSGGTAQRSERQPWWQRYYLDVVIAILGIAALWRLVGRDSPLITTSAGSSATDPFLLLAPALLFLGLGSVLLRMYPAIVGIAARILSAGRGLIGSMATWQLSREPLHYGRITFLLALAIGIGWFATSFRATVDRSQTDQAQYRVGSDARFTERDLALNVSRARPLSAYTVLPGVESATIGWRRQNVNFSGAARNGANAVLLAVEPTTFSKTVYWRSDLGALQQPTAARTMPEVGEKIPFMPTKLGLWARFDVPVAASVFAPDLDRLRTRTKISVRFQDGAGVWLVLPFTFTEAEYISVGPLSPGVTGGDAYNTTGWAYFEADFSTLAYRPVEPLRIVSFVVEHHARSQTGERFLTLALAGLSGIDSTGTRQMLDIFENRTWDFALDSGAQSQGDAQTGYADPRHGWGVKLVWDQDAENATVGALINYPLLPGGVPLIASQGLTAQLGLGPGQKITIRNLEKMTVDFAVVADAQPQHYYPSLYDARKQDTTYVSDDQNRPFAIVDRDSLLYVLNRRPSATYYPDEVWLKGKSGVDGDKLLSEVHPNDRSVLFTASQTLPGAISALQTDPLSRGLLGLMFLAFIVAMALSIVGLLTYAALTAAARRTEFGVLRALGLSPLRVIVQLAVEQVFVIGLGVVLGAALGMVLSSQVVPRLAQDASGTQITPPFIVQIETTALLQYGAIIGLVIVLVIAISLVLVRQLSLTRTLRLGED